MRKHFYDDDNFDYRRYWKGRRYEDLSEKRVLRGFLAKIGKKNLAKMEVLEIGPGFGRLTGLYLHLVNKAVLLEPSLKLRKALKKQLKKLSNYKLKEGTFEEVDFKNNHFDLIIMVRVLHHLTSPRAAIKKISRIIKPGGFFILEFPNKLHFRNRLRFFFSGRWAELFSLKPEDRRSDASIKNKCIPFFNYPPRLIRDLLEKNGFSIHSFFSVSNWRSPFLKRFLGLKILLFLEKLTGRFLSLFNFGPSIFILCQKNKE